MKTTLFFLLTLSSLIFLDAARDFKRLNATKVEKIAKKKGVRIAKPVKIANGTKLEIMTKKRKIEEKAEKEEMKSESYRVPIIVTPVRDFAHREAIPVNIDFGDGYIQSAAHILSGKENIPIIEARFSDDLHFPIQPQLPVGVDVPGLGGHIDEPIQHVDRPYTHQQFTHPGNLHHPKEIVPVAPDHYYPDDYGDFSAIPGKPGIDYPTYSSLPHTGFKCLQHTATPGFYADVDTKCQMWHYCQPDGRHDKFLCPNGTVFDQLTRVCNWWYNVHCEESLSMYDINFDLYREPVKIIRPQHIEPALSSHIKEESIPHPNSFLKHTSDFHPADDYDHHGPISQHAVDDHYYHNKDFHSAATPHHVRYPIAMAPHPDVIPDSSREEYSIYNRQDASSEVVDHKIKSFGPPVKHDVYSPSKKTTKRRRKVLKHVPTRGFDNDRAKPLKVRVYSGHNDDDIPTYRERKASPPKGRKYRVVKRRRNFKS